MTKNILKRRWIWAVALVGVAMAGVRWGRVWPGTPTAASTRAYDKTAARIMEANIRVPEPEDAGPKEWSVRREILSATIIKHDPDILGMQEVSPAQGAYLMQKLTGMKVVPRGESTGSLGMVTDMIGTLLQIYYRPERWTLLYSSSGPVRAEAQEQLTENTFYLMAVLEDNNHVLPDFVVIDTHLRHGTPNAVVCAGKIHELVAQQQKLHPGAQAIVMGDMNWGMGSPVYDAVLGAKTPPLFVDTFDYSTWTAKSLWGTYHAFKGVVVAPYPTDLIVTTDGLKAESTEIIKDKDETTGAYPSDHFFVETVVRKK